MCVTEQSHLGQRSVPLDGAPSAVRPYLRCMTADFVRQTISATVRKLVIGESPTAPVTTWDLDDPNPISADSPVRTVHADPAMFVGGVRALLFQTLHPVAMRGVAEHSDYEHDPLGRLQRTASFLGKTTYGTGAEANEAINLVRSIHSRVEGTMPDGTIYRADDPSLLGWVHASEIDSFLTAHQKYGGTRLSPHECDRYVADMSIIGSALGVDNAPQSRAELAAVLDSYRSELAPSKECRDATRFLFAPALPIGVLPFYGLIFSSAVAMLPRWARAMLLLPVAPGIDPFVLRPAMTTMMYALRWAQIAPDGHEATDDVGHANS